MVQGQPHLGVVEGWFVHVQPDVAGIERRWSRTQLEAQSFRGVEQPVQVGQPNAGYVNLVVLIHQHGSAATEYELNALESGGT